MFGSATFNPEVNKKQCAIPLWASRGLVRLFNKTYISSDVNCLENASLIRWIY